MTQCADFTLFFFKILVTILAYGVNNLVLIIKFDCQIMDLHSRNKKTDGKLWLFSNYSYIGMIIIIYLNKMCLWNTMPPIMANFNEGQDHKDKYFDTSRMILSQEMTMCNMEALVSYFSEVMTNVFF